MYPTQAFGRTGHISTRTVFGAAALGEVTQAEADRTLEVLLQYGINHLDTAASYGDAELRIGPWMKEHRGDFFLATKTEERKYQAAKESIHRSLERMKTDHLDMIQLHAVIEDAEMETALGPGGALEAAIEARQQGLVRFIGITSHTLHAPLIHVQALERFDFDAVLLPLNYPLYQIAEYRANFDALTKVCKTKNVAMQTIKSICRRPWGEQEHFASCWYEPLTEQPAVDRAVAFVLSHPAGVFLNTVGDIYVMAKVLAAASRYNGRAPSEEALNRMVADYNMIPLWPEHEGMH
jgi:predicted aldo/keto reductase-like oxidoreductase